VNQRRRIAPQASTASATMVAAWAETVPYMPLTASSANTRPTW